MDIATALREEAKYAADRLQGQMPGLSAELAEIERRKAEIESKLRAAGVASERLRRFEPRVGADFQCPRCWIEKDARSKLSPVGSDTTNDIMRCRTCGADFEIPSR